MSSWEDRVHYYWYSMKSMVVIQYSQCPVAVMSACGLVGGCQSWLCSEDRHCRVGTYCPFGWQRTLIWRSFRCSSGAGWDKFGAVICSSNLLRLCLKLSHVFCSSSGSQVGFHKTSTISLFWELRIQFFSFWLIQAGQAHTSLASIASLSVLLQQLVLSKHCQW